MTITIRPLPLTLLIAVLLYWVSVEHRRATPKPAPMATPSRTFTASDDATDAESYRNLKGYFREAYDGKSG